MVKNSFTLRCEKHLSFSTIQQIYQILADQKVHFYTLLVSKKVYTLHFYQIWRILTDLLDAKDRIVKDIIQRKKIPHVFV